jgi:hypothetical protein
MRGMKVTVDAAMRARDVSRPRLEHEAMARESERTVTGQTEEEPARAAPSDGPVAPTAGAADAPGRTPKPGPGRRRRRRR